MQVVDRESAFGSAFGGADLSETVGYLVADGQGRQIGRVECPMYGLAPNRPDALAVKAGRFLLHRCLVPVDAIEQIDAARALIGLRVDRDSIRSFL